MKKILLMLAAMAAVQTNGQIVTLVSTNVSDIEYYSVQPTDIVTMVCQTGSAHPTAYCSRGSFSIPNTSTPYTFTGLTNISVTANSSVQAATFQIVNQSSCVVSNYVPADAIVIPASATGNVQIILESSPDLINWTAAVPGTYGPSSATNRFFRVRASIQ